MAQSETAFLQEILAMASAGQMASVVRTAQQRSGWLLERSPEPRGNEPYGRLPLHRDPRGELMLAGWRAHERCAPHDHGDALGVVIVLAGRFTETRYRKCGGALARSGQTTVEQGGALQVRAGLIHDMRCDAPGATLHVYLPAIDRMRVYDLEGRATWIVDDNAGAWIPCDARHVIAVEAWPSPPACTS